ncbi:hypothetical protein Aduo_015547 [Ancylostoma duodenale]
MRHNIQLSKLSAKGESKPQILLGCDQLWNLLGTPSPRYTLPSGLQLIPSKIGYLLTGRQQPGNQKTAKDNAAQLGMVAMVQALSNEDEDLQRWDKYWTMDSAGICEFTGTKDAEKMAVNDLVMKFFNSSIEKRSDGYYVRLPYKEHHPPLPTNKAIALKRLNSVLTMLKAKPQLLEEYDKTFKSQQENNIIEEVLKDQPPQGSILHYIPHQSVITPHMETTKLRIVFDAIITFQRLPISQRHLTPRTSHSPRTLRNATSISNTIHSHHVGRRKGFPSGTTA